MRATQLLGTIALFMMTTCVGGRSQQDAHIYPRIGAEYVGGTAEGVKYGTTPVFDQVAEFLQFTPRQRRAGGSLDLLADSFTFTSAGLKPAELIPGGGELESDFSLERGVLTVRYDAICGLAAGRRPRSEMIAETVPFGTAAAAAVVATYNIGKKSALLTGITAAGGALLYLFTVRRPALQENYIAVEFGPARVCRQRAKAAPAASTSEEATPKSQAVNLVMLKIGNDHDYFNVAEILHEKSGHKVEALQGDSVTQGH